MNVITHPANQLVGRRPGYDMDYAAIYEAAAETGTALEIDGAPSHLDLSGERAREPSRQVPPWSSTAIATGAARSISRCGWGGDRQAGLGRTGPGPEHPVSPDVRAFIARKRAR